MAYVTAQEIVTEIGTARAAQLTTDTGTTPDSAKITEIISRIESRVMSVVRGRTTATISQADYPQTYALIRGMITDLVIHRLHARRPPVDATLRALHDDAVTWLKELAEGKVALPDVDLNEPDLECGYADQDAATER